ncbi:MAG: hypothetical protein ACYC35_13995 [Pirellulales bacterium]
MSVLSSADQRKSFARKPKADVYTVMLLLSFLAILVGILFLYLEMKVYNFEVQLGSGRLASLDRPAATVAATLWGSGTDAPAISQPV